MTPYQKRRLAALTVISASAYTIVNLAERAGIAVSQGNFLVVGVSLASIMAIILSINVLENEGR